MIRTSWIKIWQVQNSIQINNLSYISHKQNTENKVVSLIINNIRTIENVADAENICYLFHYEEWFSCCSLVFVSVCESFSILFIKGDMQHFVCFRIMNPSSSSSFHIITWHFSTQINQIHNKTILLHFVFFASVAIFDSPMKHEVKIILY